jgi:hypothetical protein
VNLSGAVNATIADSQGQATITNDDGVPTLSVNDRAETEGISLVFTVTLSAASGQTVTVSWSTADGTAVSGDDYQPASGTLTFNPGETSKTFSVATVGDTLAEASETFFVDLNSPTNAGILDGQGVGTILDNDGTPPSITVTAPNGGETWKLRSTQQITWSSSGTNGSVKIEVSRDGGATWSTISSSTTNDGQHAWKVGGKTSTQARIRVCSINAPVVCDQSNANFTISK